MRRPLAVFGFTVLLALLVATKLPAHTLVPCGVVFFLLALAGFYFFRKGARSYLPLILVALAVSFLFRTAYDTLAVQPIRALDEKELPVTARVEDVQPGFGDDLVIADLTILSLEGEKRATPFKVRVNNLPQVQIGDVIAIDLRFYDLSGKDSAVFNYSKGFYIGASPASPPTVEGQDNTFLCAMRQLRYTAGDNIRTHLPLRLSSVAAAMSVGDKRFLSEQTIQAYRMAGISHMLVVSGLHLSVLSGAVYAAASALVRRRRLVSVLCMATVFLFMVFTGLTPSIVRSGIACLLVYAATLFYRKADVYTSLGLAAVFLCLQNPYAAADAGLQLSFAATIGALAGGEMTTRLKRKQMGKETAKPLQILHAVGRAAIVPFAITLITLPVIALNSFGVSLFSVPVNMVAVPLLAPIVLLGFIMALPSGFFLVDFFARTAALLSGVLLVILEKITDFCARYPQMYITVGGLFFFVAILLAYLLFFLFVKSGKRPAFLVASLLVLPLALATHQVLDKNTVQLTLLGSGNNSSLLVSQNGQAAIVYRSRLSAGGLTRAMGRQNIDECVLFVDLRKSSQSTEYYSLFQPEQVLIASEELISRERLTPLPDVDLYLQAQGEGQIACVDVSGYKVAIIQGSVDLSGYPPVDVLVPGGGEVLGEYEYIWVSADAPDWASPDEGSYYSGGSAQLYIRPGRSVIFREADHDIIF